MSETELDRLLRGVDATALINEGMELLGGRFGRDDDDEDADDEGSDPNADFEQAESDAADIAEEAGVELESEIGVFGEDMSRYRLARIVQTDRDIGEAAVELGVMLAWRRRDLAAAATVLDALETIVDSDCAGHTSVVAAQAFGSLVTFGAELPPDAVQRVADLRGHAPFYLTQHLAGPQPGALRLLRSLTQHESETIRTEARANLGKTHQPPWWTGVFAADPLAMMTAEEAERHEPAIRQLAERLASTDHAPAKVPLSQLLAPLPSSVTLPVLERLVTAADESDEETAESARQLFAAPGGIEAIGRVLCAWANDKRPGRWHRANCLEGTVPAERSKDTALALLRWLIAFDPQRAGVATSPTALATELIALLWGKEEDVEPLIAVLLTLPEPAEGEKSVLEERAYGLGIILQNGRVSDTTMALLLEAQVSGWPAGLRPFSHYLRRHVENVGPERLRPFVERAVQHHSDDVRRWGLEQWLGPCFDAARDPPHPDLARTIWRNPLWRPLLIRHRNLDEQLLVPAREALRAGDLGMSEMAAVMRVIGQCYGGVAPFCVGEGLPEGNRQDPPRDVPDHLQGPPTAEEWAIVRSARDAALAREEDEAVSCALHSLPAGPWLPQDRHVVDAALAAAAAGDEHPGFLLAFMLAIKATPGDLPVYERLRKIMPAGERDTVDRQMRRYCRLLGIALPKRGKKQPKTGEKVPETGEWMDQDE